MEEKVFIKEKKGTPIVIIALVVALIGGLLGSLFTYFVVENKIEAISKGSSGMISTKYEIEYAEKEYSLVIAIKDKETDGYIIELNEPTLSNEIMHLNQEEISNYSWEEAVASNTLKDEDDNNTFAEAYSRQLDMIFG